MDYKWKYDFNLVHLRSFMFLVPTFKVLFVGSVCSCLFCTYIYLWQTQFTYQMNFLSFNSNTMGNTRGVGTAYSSGTPEFFYGFYAISQSIVFCVLSYPVDWFCFCFFCVCVFFYTILAIQLSALLLLTSSDYPFNVFIRLSNSLEGY